MVTTLNLKEFRQKLSLSIKKTMQGEKVILTLRGKPVAEITPYKSRYQIASALLWFAQPPDNLLVKTKKRAVEIIREDRNE